MKISLIIPVYNVEKYLKKCLESCLNQDISKDDYEIIIINDGSPDNCNFIISDYINKHNNIRVLNQKNSGLSIARNNGLKIAKGDYIWFIDSDDWIEDNILNNLLAYLDDADILQLNYRLVFENNDISSKEIRIDKNRLEVYNGLEILQSEYLPSPVQFTIFKREFLLNNELFFTPKIYHEDSEFKPKATFYAKKIKFFRPIVYNYLQRETGSIMSNFSLKNALDYLFVINNLLVFKRNNINILNKSKGYKLFIIALINRIIKGSFNLKFNDKKILINSLQINKQIFNEFLGIISVLNLSKFIFFNLNIRLSLNLFGFLSKISKNFFK